MCGLSLIGCARKNEAQAGSQQELWGVTGRRLHLPPAVEVPRFLDLSAGSSMLLSDPISHDIYPCLPSRLESLAALNKKGVNV